MNRSIRRWALVMVFLATAISVVSADGGGGILFGHQTSSYPFLENYPITGDSLGLIYFGGFGYGVTTDRAIVGGFGVAILDQDGTTGIAGGFGGLTSGYRLLSRPLNISIISRTGFGGVSTGSFETANGSGFFALLEEVTLEVGVPILRWFMPTVYAGYQVIGNLIPGRLFGSFVSLTPVVGLKIQWGDFY